MDVEKEGEAILRSTASVAGIATVLAEDPERVREAARDLKNNTGLTRYARVQQADKNVYKAVSSIPMRDKLSIQRAYKQSQNTRRTSGIDCILVLPTGYGKKEFFPLEERLKDLTETMLDEEIGYLYCDRPDRTNKLATKIVGQTVRGPVYFFKKSIVGEIQSLGKEEFETLYPKTVIWKGR